MEMYLADQNKLGEAGEKPERGEKSPIPYFGEAKDIKEIIDAFRGKGDGETEALPPMPSHLKGVLVLREVFFSEEIFYFS